nr:PREDICTED: uncharacterized protein LOC108192443 [Daucus carota subsp. sativus]
MEHNLERGPQGDGVQLRGAGDAGVVAANAGGASGYIGVMRPNNNGEDIMEMKKKMESLEEKLKEREEKFCVDEHIGLGSVVACANRAQEVVWPKRQRRYGGLPKKDCEPLEELYEDQLSQLRWLGFRDTHDNIQALVETSGDVHAAALLLLQDL